MVSIIAKEVNVELAKEQLLFRETQQAVEHLLKNVEMYLAYAKIYHLASLAGQIGPKAQKAKEELQQLRHNLETLIDIVYQYLGYEFDQHIHPDFPLDWVESVKRTDNELKDLMSFLVQLDNRISTNLERESEKVVPQIKNLIDRVKIIQREINFEERQLKALSDFMRRKHANDWMKSHQNDILKLWDKEVNPPTVNGINSTLSTTTISIKEDRGAFSFNGQTADEVKLVITSQRSGYNKEFFSLQDHPTTDEFECYKLYDEAIEPIFRRIATILRRKYTPYVRLLL